MKRSNHYEAAFEGYLQWHRLCYVAVDETRRCCLGETPVKNLDFIVYGDCGSRLLVDVKGRQFAAGQQGKSRKIWECWSHQEDVDGLLRWQGQFGPGYHALLVFTYLLPREMELPEVAGDLWTWRGRRFLLRAVLVEDYQREMRCRSPKWGTVFLPGASFRRLARPFHSFTQDFFPEEIAEDCPF
jgi:hypothetical protein